MKKFKFIEKIESRKKILKDDTVQDKGELRTFLIASGESGFIDLVFFSGLSVTLYSLFGFKVIPAGLVLGLMSVVIIFGKAWCAMRVSQIDELTSHLKSIKKDCWKQLRKPRRFWKTLHLLCMSISLLTAMSLSVVSVGDGIRKNQNEIKKANEEITALAELINANSIGQSKQREIIYSSVSVGTNSTIKAQEDAAKIWPIIEAYRENRAEFEAEFGANFSSNEEVVYKGQTIIPTNYWDEQNSLVVSQVKAKGRNLSINQIRNITSEAVLAQQIKNEIEALNKNTSKDDLILLDTQTKDAMTTAIRNLQGRFYWPASVGGELVEFNEDNPSLALTTLKDLKAAYENDTGDVGESAKIFVLLGPAIDNAFTAKATLENLSKKNNASSFGSTEIMIMAFILFSGLLVELLIWAFTPKPMITRKVFEKYYFDEELDIESIMYQINRKYLSKGVINLEEFYAKAEKNKSIDNIPKTLEEFKKTKRKTDRSSKPKVATAKQAGDKISEKEVAENDIEEDNIFVFNPPAERSPLVEVETSKEEEPAPIMEKSTEITAAEKEEPKKIFMKSAEAELEEMLQDLK